MYFKNPVARSFLVISCGLAAVIAVGLGSSLLLAADAPRAMAVKPLLSTPTLNQPTLAKAVAPEPFVEEEQTIVVSRVDGATIVESTNEWLSVEPSPAVHGNVCPTCNVRHTCSHCSKPGPFKAWRQRTRRDLQASHWGYPEEFDRTLRAGTLLHAHMDTQIDNAVIASMVLYRYDFHDGILGNVTALNPSGRKRLSAMAAILHCTHPLRIEPVPNKPELNKARRDHVLETLENSEYTISDDWVVVREPEPRGTSGDEALEIYKKMGQSRASGSIGSMGVSSGSSSGQGSSGGQGSSSGQGNSSGSEQSY